MKVVGLISGGKDSIFSLQKCVDFGHQIVALATLIPDSTEEELNSHCFQTVASKNVEYIAASMQIPLIKHKFNAITKNTTQYYQPTADDEVEELYALLAKVKQQHPSVNAVAAGAVLSNYQRLRVENVCSRLQYVSLAYLWEYDQEQLLRDMFACHQRSILVKVASWGLAPNMLGKSLLELFPRLQKASRDCGMHISGEGGEYETTCVSSNLFSKSIEITKCSVDVVSDDEWAPVAHLLMNKAEFNLIPNDFYSGAGEDTTQIKINFAYSGVGTNTERIPGPDMQFFHEETLIENSEIIEKLYTLRDRPKAGFDVPDEYGELDGVRTTATLHDVGTDALTFLQCFDQFQHLIAYVEVELRDLSDFSVLNSAFSTVFSIPPPCRSCVQQSISSVGEITLHFGYRQSTLHVQSVSSWAPACIGPYAQAVKTKNNVYISGQIGLCPETMKLVEPENQYAQSLTNTESIMRTMGVCFSDAVEVRIFYVGHQPNVLLENVDASYIKCIPVPKLPANAIVEIVTRFSV
ncbi:hypothetical protein PCE1_000129 [Barthelona sp. PCE]